MEKWKVNGTMRFFFLVLGGVLWLGIWLSGFRDVHWLLYIPATFLLLAALTGICPGMFFSRLLFDRRG